MSRSALWRRLLPAVLLLALPALASAETAVVEVHFLSLDEAASAVQSQLSPQGSVRSMSSRRMLIITDNTARIEAARSLLKRLDRMPAQYRVKVEILALRDMRRQGAGVRSLQLPGGWVELNLDRSRVQVSQRRRMQLRVTSARPGHIETGQLRPYRQRIQRWLAGYGVVSADTVTLEPVTSGFDIEVARAGADSVRVRLHPWMRHMRRQAPGDSRTRIDLGRGRITTNRQPAQATDAPIAIAGAETELTIALGETVTVAANSGESRLFSRALFGSSSENGADRLAIRLRVVSVGG